MALFKCLWICLLGLFGLALAATADSPPSEGTSVANVDDGFKAGKQTPDGKSWSYYDDGRFTIIKGILLNWYDARDFCYNNFGYPLATIRDWSEQNQLYTLWKQKIRFRYNLWIGLYDNGRFGYKNRDGWAWVSGYPYDVNEYFDYWRYGEPKRYSEQCVEFWKRARQRAWDDAPCSYRNSFACDSYSVVAVKKDGNRLLIENGGPTEVNGADENDRESEESMEDDDGED
jgi:hypothetical protein